MLHHFLIFVLILFQFIRSQVDALRNVESELKLLRINLSKKEDQVISIQKYLDKERDEKMEIFESKKKDEEDWLAEKNLWQLERQELKQEISHLTEQSKTDKYETFQSEDTTEISQKEHQEKSILEIENNGLKQELKRLQMVIANPQDFDYIRNSVNEEDFGYSSSRNTLEKHQKQPFSKSTSQLSEGDFHSLQHISQSTKSNFERKLKSLFRFSIRGGKNIIGHFRDKC